MDYYIQNKMKGYLGNAPIFWAKNSMGYTADLNKAEKYSEEDAKRICTGNPEKNKAWPVDYIDNSEAIQRVVNIDYLDTNKIEKFEK